MYGPELYIVSPTITGLVLQVFEVLEVRAPPSLGTYFNTKSILVLMLGYFAPCSTSKYSISAFVVAPKKKITTLRSLISVTFR